MASWNHNSFFFYRFAMFTYSGHLIQDGAKVSLQLSMQVFTLELFINYCIRFHMSNCNLFALLSINWLIKFVVPCDWRFSFNIFANCIKFPCTAKYYCVDILHFIHPFISWWTFSWCFYFLSIMNNAAMNICICFCVDMFSILLSI